MRQRRVGIAIDAAEIVRRNCNRARGDAQRAVREGERIIGARAKRALRDRIIADVLARRSRQRASQRVAEHEVAGRDRMRQRRIGIAIDAGQIIRRHCNRARRDGERTVYERDIIVRARAERALRDGVAAHVFARRPREGASQRVAEHEVAGRDLMREPRVGIAIDARQIIRCHGYRARRDGERAVHEGQRVIAASRKRALRDGVIAHVLARRPRESAGQGIAEHQITRRDLMRQRRVGIAIDARQVISRHRDCARGDGERPVHKGQRVIAASRQRALRDGVVAHVFTRHAGQRARQRVAKHQVARRDMMREPRVGIAIDARQIIRRHGDCARGDGERPVHERERIVRPRA